jgi:ribonuclease HI
MNNFLLVYNNSDTKKKVTLKHARGNISLHMKHHNTTKLQILNWIKPPCAFFKLNTDAAYTKNTSSSSFGGILRNHLGKMIFSYFGPMKTTSPLEAEFFAMIIGCHICKLLKIDFTCLILETDNSTLVDCLNSLTCPLYNRLNLWVELVTYAKYMNSIKHTFRETNAVADHLAKQGKRKHHLHTIFSMYELTKFCRNLVLLDQWDIPYLQIRSKS